MTQSNGKSNISRKWHNDIKESINKYNFILAGTFDSILTSNKRHTCNLCGQALRYVATIDGTLLVSNPTLSNTQQYNIGLDCLELVLGSTWTGFNQAKREISALKTAASIAARKEKYAKKYARMIAWLREVLELVDNKFLHGMLEVLTTGSAVFTSKMEEAVKNCAKNKKVFDLTKLRKQHARIQEILSNIQYLIDMIKEVDVLEENQTNNTLDFVQSVYNFAARTNYITEKQSTGLKKVRSRYVERKKK